MYLSTVRTDKFILPAVCEWSVTVLQLNTYLSRESVILYQKYSTQIKGPFCQGYLARILSVFRVSIFVCPPVLNTPILPPLTEAISPQLVFFWYFFGDI